jgi:hypothetical protein
MGKTVQTTNQARTGTTSSNPNIPDYIQKPITNYAGQIGGVLDKGADAYRPQVTDAQTAAWGAGKNLTGPDYSGADELLNNGTQVSAGSIQGESLLSGLENYYNPFKDQITNPVLSDYDEQSGITRAGQAAEAGRNRAFQGSRYGVEEAATEGQLARGRAATEGGLLKDMFTESANLSNLDTGRRQQASEFNARSAMEAQQANQQAELARAREMAANAQGTTAAQQANAKLAADLANQEADSLNANRHYDVDFLKETGGLLPTLDPYIGRDVTMTDVSTGLTNKKDTASAGDWFGDALTAYANSQPRRAA